MQLKVVNRLSLLSIYIYSSSVIETIPRKDILYFIGFQITFTELDYFLKKLITVSNQSAPITLTVQMGIILCIF